MHPGPEEQPLISEFADDADMAPLLEEFVGEMPGHIDQMLKLWRSNELSELRRTVHQLRGAGGGYGYPVITEAAGAVEERIDTTPDDLDAIGLVLEELVQLCARVAA